MLDRLLKGWIVVGLIAIQGLLLSYSSALAYEVQRSVLDNSALQRTSNTPGENGFLLNLTQRYYQEVDASLKQNSYFAFRYYLVSPFESFDKQQFIYENPTQANDIAMRALHNAFKKALEEIEIVEYLRDNINGLTSFKIVFGSRGTRLQGPSLKGFGVKVPKELSGMNHKTSITSGLTFADDFRLGLAVTMTHRWFVSKLRYYPTSANEIAYTAETQLTASTKVGLNYRRSDNNGQAVMTTLSFVF